MLGEEYRNGFHAEASSAEIDDIKNFWIQGRALFPRTNYRARYGMALATTIVHPVKLFLVSFRRRFG